MKLELTAADVRPIVAEVVDQVLAKLEEHESVLGDARLAFSEPEAAALLGVRPHVLRDCRIRGEIRGMKIGKCIFYSRETLLRFIRDREAAA